MLNSIFGHWKTTVSGLLIVAAHLTVNGMTIKQFAIGFLIAALGAIAKDRVQQ